MTPEELYKKKFGDADSITKESVIRLLEHLTIPLRSNNIYLLEEYSIWLTKNGYMDTDWRDEEPFAIDTFLASNE